MKLSCASRFAIALVSSTLLAGLANFATLGAQSDGPAPEESVLPVQLSAVDEIAAEDATAQQRVHVHLHPQQSLAARHAAFAQNRESHPTASAVNPDSDSSTPSTFSVPSLPAPGFYPADLSNPSHRAVLTSAKSNNIYVNCSAACWGYPWNFLTNLGHSNFIHIVDQYVGTNSNGRYSAGTASSIPKPALPAILGPTDILAFVHAAARTHGSGYGYVYHLFLPKGQDVCLSTTQCYSPNRQSTFVFCAYHGSADFAGIGHVLFTVEPYQNVPGCSVAHPSSHGALVDSTANTLSHELIETITDPDSDAWFAQNSLIDLGAEIGDLCEEPAFNYQAFTLYNGVSYAIQPEYSNKYHACATAP